MSSADNQQDRQKFIRLIALKEEHAQICKQQIYILWSDYFKLSHYQKYPQLSQQLYKLAQQCSQVKQSLDLAVVEKLIQQVTDLEEIFIETQNL